VARKLLRKEDPDGRQRSDPFDGKAGDSFLEWLIEPVQVRAGTLNRTVEALWEYEPELMREFGLDSSTDLRRLLKWLVVEGGAARAGLHPVFFSQIGEHKPSTAGSGRRRKSRGVPPVVPVTPADSALTLDKMPLSDPGPLTAWLNERIAWTAHRKPLITRLALMVYQQRPDVQAAYPDPLGHDQAEFARWFVHFGAPELGLHPSLVRPVRRTIRA